MEKAVFRIIDANFNRAREAVRVMEEFCRFALNSEQLTSQSKQLRHQLTVAMGRLNAGKLIASRDTTGDVGTTIKVNEQLGRRNLMDCVTAAGRRLSEALRALTEAIQTFDPATAQTIEGLRYSAYTLEKDILIRGNTREKFKQVRLYIIISSDLPVDIIRLAEACAVGGADCIQLRAKEMPDTEVLALAGELAGICKRAGIISIINDRVDIAVAAGADGVHLGQGDLPLEQARRLQPQPLIMGASTHSTGELNSAIQQGADYVGVGPVFATSTKRGVKVSGLEYLRQATALAESVGIVPVAVGGITLDNIDKTLSAGAKVVAVCSAVCNSADPEGVCRALKKRICSG